VLRVDAVVLVPRVTDQEMARARRRPRAAKRTRERIERQRDLVGDARAEPPRGCSHVHAGYRVDNIHVAGNRARRPTDVVFRWTLAAPRQSGLPASPKAIITPSTGGNVRPGGRSADHTPASLERFGVVFSSIVFLFYFLPAFLVLYAVVPGT